MEKDPKDYETLADFRAAGKTAANCQPHDWKLPKVGDDALVCGTCGRSIDYRSEMTLGMMASIMGRRDLRDGFRQAFQAAYDDAEKRFAPPASAAHPPPAQPQKQPAYSFPSRAEREARKRAALDQASRPRTVTVTPVERTPATPSTAWVTPVERKP